MGPGQANACGPPPAAIASRMPCSVQANCTNADMPCWQAPAPSAQLVSSGTEDVTASRARRIAGVSRAVVSDRRTACGVVALHALARPVANLPAVLIARRTFGFIPAALAHPGRWIAGSVYGAVDPIIAVDPLTKLGLELDRSHIAPWPLRARCTTLIGG